MKILKKIIIAILIIIAIPFVIALFVKKEYIVEREIVINKPEHEVFDYIKHLKNQDNYSVWCKTDPNMKKDFTGTDGTQGFIYAWDGNSDVGKGEMEILNVVEDERVDIGLRFIEPWEGTGETYLATEPVDTESTKVKWHMEGKSSYPMNFMNLFMDGMLGKTLDESLNNLKDILEKQ